jgi:hypothetical protein
VKEDLDKPLPNRRRSAQPTPTKPAPKVVAMAPRAPAPQDDVVPGLTADNMAAFVERMSGLGLRTAHIGLILGIPTKKVEADYAEELARGVAKANFKVSNALFNVATDKAHPKFAACSIYWTKARMGWAETSPVPGMPPGMEGTTAEAHDATHLTDEDAKARFEEANRALVDAAKRRMD